MKPAMKNVLFLIAVMCTSLNGCVVPAIIAAGGANLERDKKIEVLAKYEGLADKSVAVLVNTDLSTLYEHPSLVATLVNDITTRIGKELRTQNVRVMRPVDVLNWQYTATAWTSMPYGEIVKELGVDRVVLVDVYEYRLTPPGNQWIWEGVAAANVGIIERDGSDPDAFAEEMSVMATYPVEKNIPRESASPQAVEAGLLTKFGQQVAWLFYTHEEYKYPENMR